MIIYPINRYLIGIRGKSVIYFYARVYGWYMEEVGECFEEVGAV